MIDLRPPRRPATPSSAPAGVLRRLIQALLIAAIGVAGGFAYAQFSLSPAQLSTRLPGLYASMGAAIAILGVRLLNLVYRIFR